ncbi:GNAT family N-acetyltransferase [Amycolatopsis sp. OK19-0408]|uniref:GNAT family N-acetyltransferase n=1 Tax=Amycolatopsis iheyensis TaxID=2945988 RepID=A0A9X2SNN3_9PSEU|nr:GNAT family N-acetyltransferase [Amycolatopsis iheyensis]MCR6489009.1 GNAT family N-acetyltransferase [Amycolatopsis iheyensis]
MGGSPRVVVSTGQGLPDMDWAGELADLTDVFPYLGPTWLSASEKALTDLQPWHTIATRARGELALLPGYVMTVPPVVDHEPRTYLGWQAPSGEEVCCGAQTDACISGEVDALGVDPFFPALLLGSPLGYRTEVAYNFWTPNLMAQLVAELAPAAFAQGIRCIVAPWISGRSGNDALVTALDQVGGHSTFWGYEDYLRLDADSWDGHLAALPLKKRQRIKSDVRRAEAAGVHVERVDGEAIRPHVARIAELTCLNREKNGAGEEPAHIAEMLTALIDAGSDVRAYLGTKDDALVAICVVIRKHHRLFPKWAGFDYAAIGERSGIYFALVLDAPVRDAYAEGLRTVEFGAGAHQAKALRGCSPRPVTTAMVMSDPELRPQVARWMDAFGASRRVAFGDAPATHTPLPVVSRGSGACCSDG